MIVKSHRGNEDMSDVSRTDVADHPDIKTARLLAWAWENGRLDILAQFGIYALPDNPTLLELVQHGILTPDAIES